MNLDQLRRSVDRRFWRRLLDQLEERSLFDAVTLSHVQADLNKKEPEFVEWTVRHVLAGLIGRSDLDMSVDLQHALQRLVRRDAAGHNRLQRSTTLRGMLVDPMGLIRPGAVRTFLNTLDHAFCFLDKAEPVRGRLPDALFAHLENDGREPYQDRYFRIRCHNNGSVHLRLLRDDLIKEANRVFDTITRPADEPPAPADPRIAIGHLPGGCP